MPCSTLYTLFLRNDMRSLKHESKNKSIFGLESTMKSKGRSFPLNYQFDLKPTYAPSIQEGKNDYPPAGQKFESFDQNWPFLPDL